MSMIVKRTLWLGLAAFSMILLALGAGCGQEQTPPRSSVATQPTPAGLQEPLPDSDLSERPPTNRPGWDFWVFWRTGRSPNPYAVTGAIYPPPMTLLLRLVGVFPEQAAFAIWTGVNLVLLVALFKRKALLYIFFMPTLFHFAAGQLDILFLALSVWLKEEDWRAIAAGTLLTLKPQIGFILLPWHLSRWDRRKQLTWAAATAGLWGYYLLVRPEWFAQWLGSVSGTYGVEVTATPSLFSLAPFWGAALLAVLVLGASWFGLDEKSAIAAGVLAMPFGKTYDLVLLLRSEMIWWVIPLSWVSLWVSHQIAAPWPQAVVTILVFTLAVRAFFKRGDAAPQDV